MTATNRLFSDPSQLKVVSNGFATNDKTPFLVGQPVQVQSHAGTTMYGADHPGDASTTKFASFKQTIGGNKAFDLPSSVNTPQNTTGGALSAANQLRVIALVEGVAKLRARGDQVVPAGGSVVGAGGGTAAGDATLIVDGVNALGASVLNMKSTGANTKTLIIGDRIAIAGDGTTYFVTETSQALNGTTGVAVEITPPLQKATAGSEVITVSAPTGKTVIFAEAPAVGNVVDIAVLDAADVTAVTGGALTAGRDYAVNLNSFLYTVGEVSVTKLMR